MDVQTVVARTEADPAVVRVRRHDPLAEVDDRPAAGRGDRPPGAWSAPAIASRAGQPLIQIDPDKQQATNTVTESQRASREADLAFAKQQLARMQKLFEAGAVSRARAGAGRDGAEERRGAAGGRAVADPREPGRAAVLPRDRADAAASSARSSIRQGDRVTPSTVITTIDSAGRARGLHQRAARARDGPQTGPDGRAARHATVR